MMILRLSFSVSAAMIAGMAFAAPRTIADCEAIQAADAYNLCLASFGPVRGGDRNKYVAPAREPGESGERHRKRYSSAAIQRHSHSGRMHMEFTPGR